MPADEHALDCLFREARTPVKWRTDKKVPEELFRVLYDLAKLGPTSGNCSPARFVFLASEDAKARLKPALSAGNIEKAMTAPVVVVVAQDPMFFENFDRLNAEADLRSWFASDVGLSEETASRNSTLTGAYFLMAARALGLDVLPMSGFDQAMVEDTFLAAEGWRANFLLCLGYADREAEPARAARLPFAEVCRVL